VEWESRKERQQTSRRWCSGGGNALEKNKAEEDEGSRGGETSQIVAGKTTLNRGPNEVRTRNSSTKPPKQEKARCIPGRGRRESYLISLVGPLLECVE
jgi:hypothetical protein